MATQQLLSIITNDHLQLPRPSLSESQLQSNSVQVYLYVRSGPVQSDSLIGFLGFVHLVL